MSRITAGLPHFCCTRDTDEVLIVPRQKWGWNTPDRRLPLSNRLEYHLVRFAVRFQLPVCE
jgi:hypothetical protein